MASYKQTVWKTELLHEGNLQMNKLKKNKTVERILKINTLKKGTAI